ncbi:hypothetical protein REPUB_Repub18cG0009100 [Reevesia pubescens]
MDHAVDSKQPFYFDRTLSRLEFHEKVASMESRAEMSCILKVNINCDTCKKKVMDVLQNLHGVYSVVIDAEQGTVKVSGKVNPYIILKVLEKYEKHGEVTCIKFDGEVREPIYYPHNYCYGGNGYIPYGSAHPYPLMEGPEYFSWYDRNWCGQTAPFLSMAPPPLSLLPPRPPIPPPAVSQQPPTPPPPQPVINYFPPKALPVVAPPKEMNPEWCKIM